MSKAKATKSLLILLLVCVRSGLTWKTNTIPEPNICSTRDTGFGHNLFRSWLSENCPRNSVCIPSGSSHTYHCSCSFSDESFTESDRKCVPSAFTYTWISLWGVLVCVALGVSIAMLKGFRRASRKGLLHIGMPTIACSLGLLAALTFIIHGVLYIVLLAGHLNSTNYATVSKIRTIFVALHSLFDLSTVLVFGITVHYFVVCTSRLYAVDSLNLKFRVAYVGATTGCVMLCVVVPLMLLLQYALSTAAFAFFALSTWILYFQLTKKMAAMSPFFNTLCTENGEKSIAQKKLQYLVLLARQLFGTLLMFATAAVVYNLVWFFGRQSINQSLLGPGTAGITIFMYAVILFGLASVASFMHQFLDIRIEHLLETTGDSITKAEAITTSDSNSP